MFVCKKENNIKKIEGEKIMLINKICPMCKKNAFLRINSDQEKEFENYACYGGLIQEKLKSFNDFEREFVKTGYCPECQENLFMKELSKDENRFFTQDDIRDDVVEKFLNDTAEVHVDENGTLERVLDCRKAILSPFAGKLSVNEKLLYLYEFDLENEFEVDLDTGKVTEIK